MKALARILVFSIFVLGFSTMSYAEEKAMMCPLVGKMTGKGGKGMCRMHERMMSKCMVSHSIVATSDGGIVVSSCGKLAKYDKNLNLIKEVERIDQKECMAKMAEMKEKCPMCAMKEKAEAAEGHDHGSAQDSADAAIPEATAAEVQAADPAPQQ